MSSGGYAASSSGCVTRPRAREIGSTGYAGPTQHSLLIGRYVMATAEHREPCDSRGSCTVLGAPGGEIPSGDSTNQEDGARSRIRQVFPQQRKGLLATVIDDNCPNQKSCADCRWWRSSIDGRDWQGQPPIRTARVRGGPVYPRWSRPRQLGLPSGFTWHKDAR
jgi:hypothetical protein